MTTLDLQARQPRAIVPYPQQLTRTLEVGGETLTLRAVRPQDAPRLIEMVELCSPEDVRHRFGGCMRHLPPGEAAELAQVDYDLQMALVAEDAAGQILGVSRIVFDPTLQTAEYALLGRSDRLKGDLGRHLLQAILDYAAGRGVAEVWADVDHDDGRTLALARTLGFHRQEGADPTLFHLVWSPPVASPTHA